MRKCSPFEVTLQREPQVGHVSTLELTWLAGSLLCSVISKGDAGWLHEYNGNYVFLREIIDFKSNTFPWNYQFWTLCNLRPLICPSKIVSLMYQLESWIGILLLYLSTGHIVKRTFSKISYRKKNLLPFRAHIVKRIFQ